MKKDKVFKAVKMMRKIRDQMSKEIIGRKVGAPNLVVTSNLSKEEDLFNQERQRDLMMLDIIATNIVN